MSKQLINIKIDKDQQTGKQPFLIGPISHNLSFGATLLGQMKSKQGSQPRQINHPQINKLQAGGFANDLQVWNRNILFNAVRSGGSTKEDRKK